MAQTIAVSVHYGAAELKTVAQKYMMLGLLAGILICFSGIGTYGPHYEIHRSWTSSIFD